MVVYTSGYVFQDDGDALNGATVQLLQVSDGAEEASTTTNSDGFWSFNEADEDRYDVKITSGSSIRYRKWADEITLKMVDARNNEGAGIPAAVFTNLTNSTSNQVAVFSGANSTKADNDEIYLSFKMHDSAGNLDEFARMTVVATDVSTTTEDGQIEFDVIKGGTLAKVWTITSSDAAAMSFDMNVDALTIGSGADTDISLTFDANSADGVITWMEDEDYFKFSDDILMNSTERINLRDTAIYIYSSTDGQLDLVADTEIQIAATTIDINGAVDIAGDLVLSGGADGALQFTNAGENSIKIPDDQSSALIIEEADNAYITFNTTNSSEAITVAKATTFSVAATLATGTTIGNLTLANGSITDSGGALDFGNETLTTTGVVTAGGFTIGSAAILEAELEILDGATVTTTELNLIDGGTSRDTNAIADGDGVLINDAGTMHMTTVQTLAAYLDDEITAMPNLVTTGTIGTGVWEGTDVGVAHGGTGVSTLTDGGVLLGSGTSAITAMAVLADSEMIVGDGTTDPVAESGATLRTSIGVGTGDSPQFTGLTLTGDLAVNGDDITSDGNLQITGSGTAELAGTTVTLDSAADIELEATDDINIPSAVGLTFADDGQKIESDGTDFTIASGAKLNLTPTSDVHIANGTGMVIGHTAQVAGTNTAEFQVIGTGGGAQGSILIGLFQNATDRQSTLNLVRSRGSLGAATTLASGAGGDGIGQIVFSGADGTDLTTTAARIKVSVDNTVATDQVPGRIMFDTAGSDGSLTERMRIHSTGEIDLKSNALGLTNVGASGNDWDSTGITLIDDDRLKLGTGTDLEIWHDGDNSYIEEHGTGNFFIQSGDTIKIRNTSGAQGINFVPGGEVALFHDGSEKLATTANGVDVTGTVTESSDERLKENIVPITSALDKVSQMKGVNYNFIASGKAGVGVLAQDLEKVAPELVHEGHYNKSVAYGNLTAYLVEAIKELTDKVNKLEAVGV